MKKVPGFWISTSVSACGWLICIESFSFARHQKNDSDLIPFFCLVIAGIALVILGSFVRRMFTALSAVEDKLRSLEARQAVKEVVPTTSF
jgi:O-antigen/teichoic acid export membrane protein